MRLVAELHTAKADSAGGNGGELVLTGLHQLEDEIGNLVVRSADRFQIGNDFSEIIETLLEMLRNWILRPVSGKMWLQLVEGWNCLTLADLFCDCLLDLLLLRRAFI